MRRLTNAELLWLIDRRDEARELNEWIGFAINERALWQAHRDDILPAWINAYPGTRPACWWTYDAPLLVDAIRKYGNWGSVRELREPRRQTGGSGIPCAIGSYLEGETWLGVPKYWTGPNPDDPPRYESQFAYLRRHALLVPGEHASDEPVVDIAFIAR